MITLFGGAHFFNFVSLLLYPTEVKRLKCAMLGLHRICYFALWWYSVLIIHEDLASTINLSPWWLRLLSVLRRWYCCYWFVVAPIVCVVFFAFGPCGVVQYLATFLVLQSSHWERKSWLLDTFYGIIGVMWLLVFCVSSSQWGGLVSEGAGGGGGGLWYFQFIHT